MDQALWDLLRSVDTPTICNAIETAEGRRGFDNYTRQTMVATDNAVVLGYAHTARVRASAPSTEPAEVLAARRVAYYRGLTEGPLPRVAVIEDDDYPAVAGAFWGEVNTAVHKGLGAVGAVTNGWVRDLGDLAPGFPVIAGGIGPSHAFVHLTAVGVPVNILGMRVNPGDLIHADRHGACVIPAALIGQMGRAIDRMRASEAEILGLARRPGFTIEALQAAWAASAEVLKR